MTKMWKLRNKKTGEYSYGGRYFESTSPTKGKVWEDKKSAKAGIKYSIRDQKELKKCDIDRAKDFGISSSEYRKYVKEYEQLCKNQMPEWEVVEFEIVKFEIVEKCVLSVEEFLK